MPYGYRLHNAALRGWLIAAVLCLLTNPVLAQAQNQQDIKTTDQQPEAAAEQKKAPAPPITPAPPAKSGGTTVYKSDCESPKSRGEADLCEQRRMADAAEETVGWVKSQFYATIGEIVALVLTICVALVAVAAAFGSNRIARKSTERQLRAYIDITTARVEWTGNNAVSRIITKNAGQTPAHKVTHWTKGSVGVENDFASLDDADRSNLQKMTVGPSVDANHAWDFPPFRPGNDPRIDPKRTPLNVWGEIRYEDVFGNERFTKYRLFMVINPADPTQFILAPCKDGNEST